MLSLVLVAALWPASVEQHCITRDQDIMVGVAYKTDGSFLYCELISQPTEHQLHIDYMRDSKIFATKNLSYSANPLTPDVNQQDDRSGELRQSSHINQQVVLQYRPNQRKKIQNTSIPESKVDVVDAGFDNFIRLHWDELLAGKTMNVHFASIAHQKVLPLRISSQPLEKCSGKQEQSTPTFCFFVEIDNSLLRLVLGNIKLTYDQQHRLQRFSGVVNINDNDEDSQSAVIDYFYASDNKAVKLPK